MNEDLNQKQIKKYRQYQYEGSHSSYCRIAIRAGLKV